MKPGNRRFVVAVVLFLLALAVFLHQFLMFPMLSGRIDSLEEQIEECHSLDEGRREE